jgi:hypothetical protein
MAESTLPSCAHDKLPADVLGGVRYLITYGGHVVEWFVYGDWYTMTVDPRTGRYVHGQGLDMQAAWESARCQLEARGHE